MARIFLTGVVATLAPLYPQAPSLIDPLSIILWENIGYLIDDDRRAVLFAEFRDRVGLSASAILAAPGETLEDIAARGGMNPQTRIDRWREIGRIALESSDLAVTLRALPLSKARALLKRFPVIGDPGADRILLFAGIAARPCLESNGLRTLIRLGFCTEDKAYAQTYKAAMQVLDQASDGNAEWLKTAYLTLRDHGRRLCKRATPLCMACPLDQVCAHVTTSL